MPVETTFICDGCDKRLTKPSEDMPTSWCEASIRVSDLTNWRGGGSASIALHPILCPECQITLATRVDPRKWHRAVTETKA